MKSNLLTRDEQRRAAARLTMASATLELQLRSLVRRILSGEHDLLVDFQEQIQYAPPEMKLRIQEMLEVK